MSDTKLNKIIQYGTHAAMLAFVPNPAVGSKVLYLWEDTDNPGNLYMWNGATWVLISGTTVTQIKVFGITIDGSGSVITTGVKGFFQFPVNGTITSWTLLATDGNTGSIVIDIWKDIYANYPPTVADTITAASKPTISASIKNTDSVLAGWTTAITAGDVFGFNVDSVATLTRVTLEVKVLVS